MAKKIIVENCEECIHCQVIGYGDGKIGYYRCSYSGLDFFEMLSGGNSIHHNCKLEDY